MATGPHQALTMNTPRERCAAAILDALWATYRERVPYVQKYEEVISNAGAKFVNDHLAFRTLALQQPMAGIATLGRIFEALDFRAAGAYQFPDKNLRAVHYQHANPQFPKIFISELKTWELSPDNMQRLEQATANQTPILSLTTLSRLCKFEQEAGEEMAQLVADVVAQFQAAPWPTVQREVVEAVNAESQYAAWVLIHGYNVNHFTALVNSHGVPTLDDIEKTSAALAKAGVPMKKEIEGERGSKLRQTSTEAVNIDVPVAEGSESKTMPWSYAYFELAQRDPVLDPVTNKYTRFEGFLGSQATNLFEMTKVK